MPTIAARLLGNFIACLLCLTSTAFAQSWAEYNRTIALDLGVLQQSYAEGDPFRLTRNGILDTENGTLARLQLAARWQSESIFLQSSVSRSNGGTHYNGYLQAGNVLTPFASITGNIMWDVTVRAGLPIARTVQWIPFIEFQQHQWNRQLAQYSENYLHRATLLGLQLQWRQDGLPWSVELEGAIGQVLSAQMNAPAFRFNQVLGNRGIWQLGGTIAYDLTPQWRIHSTLAMRSFGYGQSAIQSGVLLPTNQSQQTMLSAGVAWHY